VESSFCNPVVPHLTAAPTHVILGLLTGKTGFGGNVANNEDVFIDQPASSDLENDVEEIKPEDTEKVVGGGSYGQDYSGV
jgi:hypothetical protein